MSRFASLQALKAAAAYAAGVEGVASGIPQPNLSGLIAKGWAERHPMRHGFLHRHTVGKGDVHFPVRLTAAGFAAAGRPHRVGALRVIFRDPARLDAARCVTLACGGGKLRVVLSVIDPPAGTRITPHDKPASQVRELDDVHAALDSFERACALARRQSGAEGRLIDPAFLAWDGPVLRLEDVAALDAAGGVPVEEVLATMRASLDARHGLGEDPSDAARWERPDDEPDAAPAPSR